MITLFIFFLLLAVILNELFVNRNHIFHSYHGNAVPTIPVIQNCIISIIDCLQQSKFTFIDVGSGNGTFLSEIVPYTNFSSYIGVEIDKTNHDEALSIHSPNVKFINKNILCYEFQETPTMIYLYEPFFSMQFEEAVKLYQNIFERLPKQHSVVIIYVTGVSFFGRSDLICSKMFEKHNFKVVTTKKIGSIFIKRTIIVATKKYKESKQLENCLLHL